MHRVNADTGCQGYYDGNAVPGQRLRMRYMQARRRKQDKRQTANVLVLVALLVPLACQYRLVHLAEEFVA